MMHSQLRREPGRSLIKKKRIPELARLLHRTALLPRHATARLRVLPDFVIIGAQKAGTASLYAYLTQHPLVLRAGRKEVHFFDDHWDRGAIWYRAFFPTTAQMRREAAAHRGRSVTGEASPFYMFDPVVPGRVRSLLPAAKLIAILRNPVDRAYSQFNFYRFKGHESRTFAAAIEQEIRAGLASGITEAELGAFNASGRRPPFYLARGVYAEQLLRWFEMFPPAQIKILDAAELYGNTIEAVHSVQSYLGLQTAAVETSKVVNQNQYSPLDPGLRRDLNSFYAEHNRRLNRLLGRDFNWE